jgi:hypothetical protein
VSATETGARLAAKFADNLAVSGTPPYDDLPRPEHRRISSGDGVGRRNSGSWRLSRLLGIFEAKLRMEMSVRRTPPNLFKWRTMHARISSTRPTHTAFPPRSRLADDVGYTDEVFEILSRYVDVSRLLRGN